MGVPEKRPLADFLPTISIKAKDFAAEDIKKVGRRLASEEKKVLDNKKKK